MSTRIPKPVFKALRRKLWLRRWSSLPDVAIRRTLSWPMRVVCVLGVIGLGALVAFQAYEAGRSYVVSDDAPSAEQFASLQNAVRGLETERDNYRATVDAAESRLNIEKAVKAELAEQVRSLEEENTKLKEDLIFFESLLPATGGSGLSIRSLKAERIDPARLRYRVLLMRGGRNIPDFHGNYQLDVVLVKEGKNVKITFPELDKDAAETWRLSFKHYQRIEGVVDIPPDAAVKSVQVRILERGTVRAQQSENL